MPSLVSPLANQHPIITDADRAFGEMLRWMGVKQKPNPTREMLSFDFRNPVRRCARTGVIRAVGISLRRGGELKEAEDVLNTALSLAKTGEEQAATLQEISLLHQQLGSRKTKKARAYLSNAKKALGNLPVDSRLQLNIAFGLLSQTIVALKNQPWMLFKIPFLFRKYRHAIVFLRKATTDRESVALHESLYFLFKGRLRFKLLGWLARSYHPLANWIRKPFDTSRSVMEHAMDIHIHSHIDVLAYRALALAYFGSCKEAQEDLNEIDRLISILNDNARTKHWEIQKQEILERCEK